MSVTLIERAATESFSLGMEVNCDSNFPITKPQCIMSFWSTSMRCTIRCSMRCSMRCTSMCYSTCPYPSWLAPEKWCRLYQVLMSWNIYLFPILPLAAVLFSIYSNLRCSHLMQPHHNCNSSCAILEGYFYLPTKTVEQSEESKKSY